MDPNAFHYGGSASSAQNAQNQFMNQGEELSGRDAPQIQNQYDARDQGNVQNSMSGQGGLAGYYQGQMNGTGPSLAAMQSSASTEEGLAAQQASANSAHGSLSGALAQRGAQTAGTAANQSNAYNAMVGRTQEANNAANGLANVYNQQGQLGLQEQGLNAGQAQNQAQLQAGQNALNQQGLLGSQQMAQNIGLADQQGAENYQTSSSQAIQAAQNQQQQNNQFNASQQSNMVGGAIGAISSLFDADMQEPGPKGEHSKNGFILREESGGSNHDPFILAYSKQSGKAMKLDMKPLTPSEQHQAAQPHGAGPLGADQRPQDHLSTLGIGAPSQYHDAQVDDSSWGGPIQGPDQPDPYTMYSSKKSGGGMGAMAFADAPGNLAGSMGGGWGNWGGPALATPTGGNHTRPWAAARARVATETRPARHPAAAD